MKRAQASAVVHVVVEVSVGAGWGPDCTVGQVHEQATMAAVDAVRKALESAGAQQMRIRSVASTEVFVGFAP